MVTENGYTRRTYEEILTAKIEKAKELFGADINTDGNTALGKYIRINAYDQYNVEQIAEKIYYSIFPQTASGYSLDRLAWTIGLTRKVATRSIYKIEIAGEEGTAEKPNIIKSGFEVGTEAGLTFHNIQDTIIGEGGTCILTVECNEAGTIGNVAASDIVKIINPVSYVHEIVADSAFAELVTEGGDEESDADFLERYERARDGQGACNESAIISAILSIDEVSDVYVKVTESEADGDIPANTIACYVRGGETAHQEIAQAIFDKKPIGVGTYGNISVSVSYGALTGDYAYSVKFSHAEESGVYIKLKIETDNTFDSTLADDKRKGDLAIKANIENFIRDLKMGEPLIATALYSAIYSVKGVTYATIEGFLSEDTGETVDKISVEPYQICSLSSLVINDKTI